MKLVTLKPECQVHVVVSINTQHKQKDNTFVFMTANKII